MTRVRWTVRLAVAALLVAAAAPIAAAHDDVRPARDDVRPEHDDFDPARERVDAETALTTDARIIAASQDWPVEAALEHLDAQQQFVALSYELSQRYERTYAGAVFAKQPGDVSLIRFVGEPPAVAARLAEEYALPIEIVGDAQYSQTELQDRARAVHRALQHQGFREVVTATTPEDTILASVVGDQPIELPRRLAEGVVVEVYEEPIAVDEHSRGGARLLDDGVFECTSGFAVRSTAGVSGIATAGHCVGLNQYQQPEDGLVYSMTHQAQHVGWYGDLEWKTTVHIEPAEFYATATQIRDVNVVTPAYSLPVNTWSCVYGRSSDQRACDRIFSTFVTATTPAGTASSLYAMDNDNTIGGDSGGPWSFATIADGIHKGDITIDGGRRNVWSQVGLLPAALGVEVDTK